MGMNFDYDSNLIKIYKNMKYCKQVVNNFIENMNDLCKHDF